LEKGKWAGKGKMGGENGYLGLKIALLALVEKSG
jgi:hypothetical protein